MPNEIEQLIQAKLAEKLRALEEGNEAPEGAFAILTTDGGRKVNNLLAEARQTGDNPPYREEQRHGKQPAARLYDTRLVFEWLSRRGTHWKAELPDKFMPSSMRVVSDN